MSRYRYKHSPLSLWMQVHSHGAEQAEIQPYDGPLVFNPAVTCFHCTGGPHHSQFTQGTSCNQFSGSRTSGHTAALMTFNNK